MAFVALSSDAGAAPTFFEMVAADRLMPSLKAAAAYSLSVFAQRRPALHRALAHQDELFAALALVLESHALATHNASFADTLYGLRRAPVAPGGAAPSRRPLTRAERRRTLALLVLAPYARAKLDALYRRATRPGPGGARVAVARPRGVDAPPPTLAARAAELATATLVRLYPALVGAVEGARFVFQTAYLLDSASPPSASASSASSPPPPRFFGPSHALLRQAVVRVSGPELADADARTRAVRAAALASKGALARGAARAGWAVADHGRSALILAVFGFKALEWWYSTGETALGGRKPLPPPPPPPPPAPSPAGVPVPDDPALCPLCARPRTNPAMATVSGYVFCYPCLHAHVVESGACPVTRLATGLDGVRRLYQAS